MSAFVAMTLGDWLLASVIALLLIGFGFVLCLVASEQFYENQERYENEEAQR